MGFTSNMMWRTRIVDAILECNESIDAGIPAGIIHHIHLIPEGVEIEKPRILQQWEPLSRHRFCIVGSATCALYDE